MQPISELPQSDPKLKEAAAEINAICQKYGIAGFYGLASSTHAEFKVNFPEWCVVQSCPEGYRVQANHEEHDRVEASLHVVFSLRDIAGLMFQNFEAVTATLHQHFEVEHESFSRIWDLDGWQKPNLPPSPYEVIDYKEPTRGKGFGKQTKVKQEPGPGPVVTAVGTLIQLAIDAGESFTVDMPNLNGTANRGIVIAFHGDANKAEALSQLVKSFDKD